MAELTVITNHCIRYTIPVKEVEDESDDPHTWDMHLWWLYDQRSGMEQNSVYLQMGGYSLSAGSTGAHQIESQGYYLVKQY